jgi:hypothetical protein
MAMKTFYATRDLKNPSYGTRMLKAGDPVELDGPKSRLYLALGAVSPTKPKGQAAQATPNETRAEAGLPPIETPAKPKTTPRKRATKKRATAKK